MTQVDATNTSMCQKGHIAACAQLPLYPLVACFKPSEVADRVGYGALTCMEKRDHMEIGKQPCTGTTEGGMRECEEECNGA